MGCGDDNPEIEQRMQPGEIRQRDVKRRLAELAFGRANDCVRLALEDAPDLENLDLSLLREIRRNDKGTVEIRLIDRLQALKQLMEMAGEESDRTDAFFQALQGGGEM